MHTVDIPGGTATVRDPSDLTERQRRPIRTVMLAALSDAMPGGIDVAGLDKNINVAVRLTPALGDAMFQMRDASILAGLVSWSIPRQLPTEDTLLDLPADLYDALADATAELSSSLTLDTSPSPDPASPTRPSSASDGLLRAAETPNLTLSISGGNTSTESSSD